MRRTLLVLALMAGIALLTQRIVTKRTWGPDLLADSMYRSGRRSLCKAPGVLGDSIPTQSLTPSPSERVISFDVDQLRGGRIQICSEYGRVQVHGVAGTQARLALTLSDPFPGEERAIADTRVSVSVRGDGAGLHVSVWQLTQGMTTFRSIASKGARPVAVNVVLEVPRTGVYDLGITSNHQRVAVRDLDVTGTIQGYLSPGADLDIGLGAALTLDLNGATLKADWRREAGVDYLGGTTAILHPLGNARLEVAAGDGAVDLRFEGSDIGLDVTARGDHHQETVEIGPTEGRRVDSTGTYARSVGYAASERQVLVRATSKRGSVAVRCCRP